MGVKYTIAELKSIAKEKFAYILIYCPDFPAEDRTDTQSEFSGLINS